MKILMLSHSPNNPNGGASRVFHLLDAGLSARGHDVTTLHLEDLPVPRQKQQRLIAERLSMPQLLSKGAERANAASYDVVLSASGMAYPIFRSLRGSATRPKLVNLVHGLAMYDHAANMTEDALGHWKVSAQYRLVTGPNQVRWDAAGIRYADTTVVQNLRDLSEVHEMVTAHSDVVMIPPAIHPELLAASETVQPQGAREAGRLLWFGTWEARKGAHHLPGALREIRRRHPEVTLTMGGTGKTEAEMREVFDPQDRSSVTVLPRISVAEQAAIFNESSIFLFPSLSEGFGLAIAEAMCFGMAGVTTATAFGGDHLHDGVDAMVVPPSSEHLSRAVITLIENADLRASMSAAGREIARAFTVERQAEAYETMMLSGSAARTSQASQ